MFDHVIVYRKSDEFSRGLLERTDENDSNYRLEDKDGVFRLSDYTCNKTAEERPNLYYPIIHPKSGEEVWPKRTRVWAYSPDEQRRPISDDLIWWGKDGEAKVPSFKRYRHALKRGGKTVPSTWWPHEFAGHTDEAKKRKLFELLTAHSAGTVRAGELELGVDDVKLRFKMLMEDSWRDEVDGALAND